MTEKLICYTCNAPISDVDGFDHSFSAPYGDTVAHYNHIEYEFVCENGHGNDQAVLCEGELAKRYYTRFGFFDCKHPPFTIELTTDIEWVEKCKPCAITGYHNRMKGLCDCGKPFDETDLSNGVCHKCFREVPERILNQKDE